MAADKTEKLSELLSSGAGALFYPPIFLMDGKGSSLILIARQWVWSEYMSKALYQFQAMVIRDGSQLQQIFDADDAEIQSLTDGVTLDNTKRNTTKDREKSRATGRICPFCGGVIRRPRSKIDRVKNGGHVVSCENNVKSITSEYHGVKCDFVMSLTDAEMIKFKN